MVEHSRTAEGTNFGRSISIDITPTWSGILPAMLDAFANVRRQRSADQCDGFDDGWCTVHDANWPDEGNARYGCDTRRDTARLDAWTRDRDATLASLYDQFQKMAQPADLYNEKVQKENG